MEIEVIRNIWKEQKAKDNDIKSSRHYSNLLQDIEKHEKKTKKTYTFMSILMLLTIFIIDRTAVDNIPDKTLLTLIGFIMIYVAIAAIVTVSWATLIKFDNNSISESSFEFLKKAKQKLTLRNKIRIFGIPVYLSMLTGGITLTYIQITEAMQTEFRILAFSLFYIFIITVTVLTYKKENKKYSKTLKPIENRINSFLSEEQ